MSAEFVGFRTRLNPTSVDKFYYKSSPELDIISNRGFLVQFLDTIIGCDQLGTVCASRSLKQNVSLELLQ
jgi:hypothetical protein